MRPAAVFIVVGTLTAALLTACAGEQPGEPASTAPTSQEDFDARMNACMSDKGWEPVKGADGSFSFETTDEQKDVFLADNTACLEFIGANLEAEKSDDEWRDVHTMLVGVHDCLVAQDLDLPDPPSFQAWMDMDRAWGPYGDVPLDVIETRSSELEGACPQPTVW
jgi:hypothetical protein